jgi:hypothetical protein
MTLWTSPDHRVWDLTDEFEDELDRRWWWDHEPVDTDGPVLISDKGAYRRMVTLLVLDLHHMDVEPRHPHEIDVQLHDLADYEICPELLARLAAGTPTAELTGGAA